MNHINKLFLLVVVLQHYASYAVMITGTITQHIITSSSTTRSELYIISDSQNYTNGGLTFTYPVGIFTLPPVVQIAVESNISHPVTEAYVAEISANNATATTVIVYKISSGVVTEAASNDVTICLLAIANPV